MSIWVFWPLSCWHNAKGHEHKFRYDLFAVHQPRLKRTIKQKPLFFYLIFMRQLLKYRFIEFQLKYHDKPYFSFGAINPNINIGYCKCVLHCLLEPGDIIVLQKLLKKRFVYDVLNYECNDKRVMIINVNSKIDLNKNF